MSRGSDRWADQDFVAQTRILLIAPETRLRKRISGSCRARLWRGIKTWGETVDQECSSGRALGIPSYGTGSVEGTVGVSYLGSPRGESSGRWGFCRRRLSTASPGPGGASVEGQEEAGCPGPASSLSGP